MTAPAVTCRGTKKDGTPCPTKANLGETGYCPWHDPDTRRRSAIQAAGGSAPHVLDLGALETVEDAFRWTRMIGSAVARGEIGAAQSNALMRVVAQWHKNEDLRLRRNDLRDLERQVRELQRRKGGADGPE